MRRNPWLTWETWRFALVLLGGEVAMVAALALGVVLGMRCGR